MELVFTEDIVGNVRGSRDVKFRAGERRDYSRATWDRIAASIGKSLGSITATPEQMTAVKRDEQPAVKRDERTRRRLAR